MIKESIQRLADKGEVVYSIIGTVIAIDHEARTCDVAPNDNTDAVLYEVMLQAAFDSNTGIVIFPKVGSDVIVTMLDRNTGYVALMSEIENIEIKTTSVDIKAEVTQLYEMLEKMLDTIKGLKLLTQSGPTVGISPLSLKDIILQKEALKQRKNTILTLFK